MYTWIAKTFKQDCLKSSLKLRVLNFLSTLTESPWTSKEQTDQVEPCNAQV